MKKKHNFLISTIKLNKFKNKIKKLVTEKWVNCIGDLNPYTLMSRSGLMLWLPDTQYTSCTDQMVVATCNGKSLPFAVKN